MFASNLTQMGDSETKFKSRPRHSPVTIRNVFHFWTETVSMVATVAAITKQQLIFVVPTMTKLAILQPKINSSFKKDERTLVPRVAKVA